MKSFYINVSQEYGKILATYIDENGEKRREKLDYFPTLFVTSPAGPLAGPSLGTKYHTITGQEVYPLTPGDIKETRDFVERHKDTENFPIYGFQRYQYEWISDNYPGDIAADWDINLINIAYLDIEVKSDDGFPDPSAAEKEVTAITIKDNNGIRTYGCKHYLKPIPGGKYYLCFNEEELLTKFLSHWIQNYPDIVTGWNVKKFDILYIVNRLARLFGDSTAKRMSPWGKIKEVRKTFQNKEEVWFELLGVATIDYMEMYKKYGPAGSRESYSLNYISYYELKQKKLSYAEYGSLHNLYETNFELFIDYNIRDTTLVEDLEKKLRLIQLALILAYDSKVNYEDVFYQTRMWDSLIYNFLKERNIVSSPNVRDSKANAYEGAYVKEPYVGRHKWVISLDYTSLYPSLMMQFNISPDTIVEPEDYPEDVRALLANNTITPELLVEETLDLSVLKKHGMVLAANGQLFRTTAEGFLPIILRKMFADRQKYKKLFIEAKKEIEKLKHEISVAGGKDNMAGATYDLYEKKIAQAEQRKSMYDLLQLCKKVCLNSCYGATGTPYFRYYDIRQAVAVTLSGQYAIKYIEKNINLYLNGILGTKDVDYVVYADTDSVYLVLDKLVEKAFDGKNASPEEITAFLDKACEQGIQPYIRKLNKRISGYTNATTVDLDMKRESICSQAIWTAKKRYILSVNDQEGVRYDTPEIKMSGIEAVKSSTPEVCRQKIKDALKIITTGTEDEIHKFIFDFKQMFMKLPPEDIAFPRGLSGLSEYADPQTIYKKGTPVHVKGALHYNHYLKEAKLDRQYPLIKEGDKIKFLYIREPNPHGIAVFSFVNVFPKELTDIIQYVDYNAQFEKTFLDPLNIILSSVGWSSEPKSSLGAFFV